MTAWGDSIPLFCFQNSKLRSKVMEPSQIMCCFDGFCQLYQYITCSFLGSEPVAIMPQDSEKLSFEAVVS